ncbi:acyl-CoA synthetase [Tsukamurella soli]|uniref:Acyl-CoA synthetase n=2 Tax=Tsukamurella soli TaxID=644556 RepID=A0ABP8J188_9ACTN
MRNEIGFVEVNLAATPIGAIPVPVNWHWTGADLEHLLGDSGVKVAVVHTDLIDGVEEQAPDGLQIVEAQVPDEVRTAYGLGEVPLTGRYPVLHELIAAFDPAEVSTEAPPMGVIYTSGTTGLAKGIVREPVRRDQTAGLLTFIKELIHLDPEWTCILPAPLYHTAPNVNVTFAAALGMNMIIMPKFDPEEFLRLVQESRVDTVQMVPTMFVRLLQLPGEVRASYDLSSLKAIVHAAAPCPPEVKRAMIDWVGPIVWEYYGGSEGGSWVECGSEDWLAHPGTVGKPCPDCAIKILTPDLEEVPTGETGIIYGRATSFWPEFTYLGNDAKRREIDAGEGFVTVGDVGHVDEDGFLYLSDRLNDMVISGGVNIYPAEIESCLLGLDGVADVAVFGIPDERMGEALAAHVELVPGAVLSEDDVRRHVRENLASYKVPKVVVFDERLPREDSGKLFKRRLKVKYWPDRVGA